MSNRNFFRVSSVWIPFLTVLACAVSQTGYAYRANLQERFTWITHAKGTPNSPIALCIHIGGSIPEYLGAQKTSAAFAGAVESGLVQWWSKIDDKNFPENATRGLEIQTFFAKADGGAFAGRCNESKYPPNARVVNAYLVTQVLGIGVGTTLGVFSPSSEDFKENLPANSVIIQYRESELAVTEVILHELGDTYQVNDKGDKLIPMNGPDGNPEPASIMNVAKGLTEHDKEAANCVYCAHFPGAYVPSNHPCCWVNQSGVCNKYGNGIADAVDRGAELCLPPGGKSPPPPGDSSSDSFSAMKR